MPSFPTFFLFYIYSYIILFIIYDLRGSNPGPGWSFSFKLILNFRLRVLYRQGFESWHNTYKIFLKELDQVRSPPSFMYTFMLQPIESQSLPTEYWPHFHLSAEVKGLASLGVRVVGTWSLPAVSRCLHFKGPFINYVRGSWKDLHVPLLWGGGSNPFLRNIFQVDILY